MCTLFGVKVNKVQIFSFNSSNVLGYVQYCYNKRSLYQLLGLFFIGYAPFILSFSFFWLITFYLLGVDLMTVPAEQDFFIKLKLSLMELLEAISIQKWQGILWLFISASILIHMMPSSADLKGARVGEVVIILLFIICLFIEFITFQRIVMVPTFLAQKLQMFGGMLMNTCVMSALVTAIVLLLSLLANGLIRIKKG